MRFSKIGGRGIPAWLVAAALAGGCGDEAGPPREAVSGKVTYDGKPVERGSIQFLPKQAAESGGAWGSIVDGAYAIPASDGPVAGEYAVSITSAPEASDAADALPGDDSGAVAGDVIPEDYNLKTTLTATVEPGKANTADFDLARKAAPRKGRRP
ncbi:hypothetical protein [Planctomyces sp. SH-PL62]|uniref:hypothetical protein n=1 Tax=Planctomyces sp. SH-PL62 TaxID=1636152 RepID=UPI00078BBCDF|nr:hypothetical protein [Planctomyces sp. SH-PL62]AMV40657.1 hypothetical protein VT85_24715 [Planctomyces sp. SH-PL62]